MTIKLVNRAEALRLQSGISARTGRIRGKLPPMGPVDRVSQANHIHRMEWILVGIAGLGLIALIVYIVRQERAATKRAQSHGPHTPGPGNDPKAIARSVAHGQDWWGGHNGGGA